MAKPIRINLGCGRRKLDGWINVDIKDADVNCDISGALPFPDNYADEVMAIHLIEHFYPWEAENILTEWRRILKPGGVLVLECPDLMKVLRHAFTTGKLDGPMFFWPIYGDPGHKNPYMMHKWAYSPETLKAGLKQVGFELVAEKPAQYHKKEKRDMRVEAIK